MKDSIFILRLFMSKLNGILQRGFGKLYDLITAYYDIFSHVNIALFLESIQDTLETLSNTGFKDTKMLE